MIEEDELTRKLARGGKLRVKLGVDPTAPDLHLGHSVVLNKLRAFQDAGHTVVFIIGDFTARIGDPSGRSETRPTLSNDTVKKNGQTYADQVCRVLDRDKTEIRWNSEWLSALSIEKLFDLAARYTVARMLERDDFSRRYKDGSPITVLEFLYPLMQAYDSVAIKSDVEVGGSDQKFNLLVGREIMRSLGMEPQSVVTYPLLVGTDGVRKMSKSYGNHIAWNDTPDDMFGKTMSLPDVVLETYYNLLTDELWADAKALHPKEAKVRLAKYFVGCWHSRDVADAAAARFEKMFSRKEIPDDMKTVRPSKKSMRLSALLVEAELAPSRKEAQRLITQGAVEMDSALIREDNVLNIDRGFILKAGKRRFCRVEPGR